MIKLLSSRLLQCFDVPKRKLFVPCHETIQLFVKRELVFKCVVKFSEPETEYNLKDFKDIQSGQRVIAELVSYGLNSKFEINIFH